MLELIVNGEIRFSTILHLLVRHYEFVGLFIICIATIVYKLITCKQS